VQDYLAAIYDLAGSGKPVIGARLAKHMAISAPAVTEAIHRMARGGYVKIGRGKELTLSPKGRQIAEVMARRHRLLERWLTDTLGLKLDRRARGSASPRARAFAARRGPAGRAPGHAEHVPAR
jgi:DtxR family Mn-dependent transcriptional regulator